MHVVGVLGGVIVVDLDVVHYSSVSWKPLERLVHSSVIVFGD